MDCQLVATALSDVTCGAKYLIDKQARPSGVAYKVPTLVRYISKSLPRGEALLSVTFDPPIEFHGFILCWLF